MDDIVEKAKETFDAEVVSLDDAVEVDNTVFSNLMGYEPKEIEERGPRLLRGKFNAIIMRFGRNTGEFPSGDKYDKYQLSVQIDRTVEADVDGKGIYVQKDYSLLNSDFGTGEQTIRTMIDEMQDATGKKFDLEASTVNEMYEKIDMQLTSLVGEEITIRVYPKVRWIKGPDGGWEKEKALPTDIEGGALVDSKGFLIKVDKNGYIVHGLMVCKKVNLDSDVVVD